MESLHAKYPFFEAAREAVATADVSLPAMVAADAPAVERGRERVERALLEGTVEPDVDANDGGVGVENGTGAGAGNDARTELLSYPIARILVSLLESDAAVEKYATAEARTAADRFVADFERDDKLQSIDAPTVDLDGVLREFDLAAAIRPAASTGPRGPDHYWIRVGEYLSFTSGDWGESWRLVNRPVADGEVRVEREELRRVLEAAIRDRVLEGLPFELEADDRLAVELESQVADLKRLLSERTHVGPIDVVVPELFPPCMRNLIDKAEREAELSPPESFALMAFLTGIGMSPDEVVEFCADTSLDAEGIRYQTEYLRDDTGTQYPPPTCETLSAYGICHNEDDHWRVAADPLAYYETKLEEAGDEVTGWRERE